MKAAVTLRYGPPEVVRIEERPVPELRKGELLVRVCTAAVTSGDARIRALDVPKGFRLPLRLALGWRGPRRDVQGYECAGVVETVGPGVTGFAPGDPVMGVTGIRGGGHARFAVVPAARAFPVPDGLSWPEAAGFFFGGVAALHFLVDRAGLARGERLLVNGATGAVGTAALQVARGLGAETTAVCRAENHDLARSLGAARCIDYRTETVTGSFDVIMDNAGTLPYRAARQHLLAEGGRLLAVVASLGENVGAALRSRRGPHRIVAGTAPDRPETMARLLALHAEGVYRPVVGTVLPFEDIVEAHRLASARHKQGAVVVRME